MKTPEVLEEAYGQYLKGGDKSGKRKSNNFLSEDLSESLYSDCTEDRIPRRKENYRIKGLILPFISLAWLREDLPSWATDLLSWSIYFHPGQRFQKEIVFSFLL